MLNIIFLILPLAAVDSLNPLTIATHIFLLTTKKPLKRAIGYIAGVFLMYFIGGFLLILGAEQILKSLLNISIFYEITLIGYIIELILGIWAVYYGYKISKKKENQIKEYFEKAKSLSFYQSFLLGLVATVGDLPTAIPYFAAIALILKTKITFFNIFILLFIYCLIYVLPLIILLCFIFMRKSALLFQKAGEFIDKWSNKILVAMCVLVGILLVIDSIGFFLGHPIF